MVGKRAPGHAEGDVDRILRERFFPGPERGTFVEVGAARPDYLSISALYRSLGWQVIAIEPNPAYRELYLQKGYQVLQYACGDHDEDGVDFCVVDSHGARYEDGQLSYESFSSLAIKDAYSKLQPGLDVTHIKVDLRRLDTILATHAPAIERIDILAVDVEGWELEVLAGLGFARYRPRAMVIENLFQDRAYRTYMRERGYFLWRCLPPNDVYVAQGDAGALERLGSFLVHEQLLTRWRRGSARRLLGKARRLVS